MKKRDSSELEAAGQELVQQAIHRCPACGCHREESSFLSDICGWCDKIRCDVELDRMRGAL